MSFDIEEFKARTSNGFLRTSYFYVAISPPGFWKNKDTSFLSFLCSGIQFPGASVIAPGQVRWGYGPSRKMPAGMVHPDVTMTVYSDGGGLAEDFFQQWTQNVVSFGDEQKAVNGVPFGLVHYPKDYMAPAIDVYYMSESGAEKSIFKCTFADAFPMGMGSVDLNWGSGGQVAQFVVPINYRTFKISKNLITKQGQIEDDANYEATVYNSPSTSSAMSISSGFIGMDNIPLSLSQALTTLSSPFSSLAQKILVVGNVVQNDVSAFSGLFSGNSTQGSQVGVQYS